MAELDGAGVALIVLEPDMVIDPEGSPVAAAVDAGRAGSGANDAERPVAFLHDGGVEEALPATYLSAAHCGRQ